jgi:hypothetical protein
MSLPRIQLAAIIETDPTITGSLIDEFRRRYDQSDPTVNWPCVSTHALARRRISRACDAMRAPFFSIQRPRNAAARAGG